MRCTITLTGDDNILYIENNAEVLFKSDGLSGIGIFNSSLFIRQNENKYKNFGITLNYSLYDDNSHIPFDTIDSAPLFLRKYLKERKIQYPDVLTFSFKDFYSFEDSQISYGGILLSERNSSTLSLLKYPNIFPLGEVMDNNFICGGYNMGNALIEGYIVGKDLLLK